MTTQQKVMCMYELRNDIWPLSKNGLRKWDRINKGFAWVRVKSFINIGLFGILLIWIVSGSDVPGA